MMTALLRAEAVASVDSPPCMRQRPFSIAVAWHSAPARRQRGADPALSKVSRQAACGSSLIQKGQADAWPTRCFGKLHRRTRARREAWPAAIVQDQQLPQTGGLSHSRKGDLFSER